MGVDFWMPFPGGAGLRPESPGGRAYVLLDGAEPRSLGGVLAWALRFQAGSVHLLVDSYAEVLARRAEPFNFPVTVWAVDMAEIVEIVGRGFSPPPPLPAKDARWASVLRAAGVEPVVEFGVLRGEVLGLEVARAVDGRLDVGVGTQDQAFHRELEPQRAVEEVLAEVVARVRRYRNADAPTHLANTLAGERWLRHVLVSRPDLVGVAWLAPMPPAVPRRDLRTPNAAMAAGVDLDGRPVVVAASAGIDLDLVPAAADARRAAGLDGDCPARSAQTTDSPVEEAAPDSPSPERSPRAARLILAVPTGYDHPRIRQLAALLRKPAEVVIVPTGWKALTGTL